MAAGAAAAAAGVPLPVFAEGGSSVSSFFETEEGRQLIVFFGQTLISWGVPAAVALVFVLLAYKPDKGADEEDSGLPPQLAKALGLGKEPKEYLAIERLNAKLQSFDYSFAKATASKESALRASERLALERRFGAEVSAMGLESEVVREIAKAEKQFRKTDETIAKELAGAVRTLRAESLAKKSNAGGGAGAMGLLGNLSLPDSLPGLRSPSPFSGGEGSHRKTVRSLQDRRMANELAFLAALSNKLQPEQASRLAAALKPAACPPSSLELVGVLPSSVLAVLRSHIAECGPDSPLSARAVAAELERRMGMPAGTLAAQHASIAAATDRASLTLAGSVSSDC